MEKKEVTGWTGWVAFASFLLMFDGIMQIIYGFAAVLHQGWYITTSQGAAIINTAAWGWVGMLTGLVLLLTGLSLLRGNAFGRVMGTLFVALGFIVNLALLAVTPIWSSIALVAYALAGYAILAHGGEMRAIPEN
jgi:hypothetical protein